jgi:hypothetical protein
VLRTPIMSAPTTAKINRFGFGGFGWGCRGCMSIRDTLSASYFPAQNDIESIREAGMLSSPNSFLGHLPLQTNMR